MSERNKRSKNGNTGPSSSSKGQSKGKAKATEDPKYVWSPSYTEIFLELVNMELKSKSYVTRVPDNSGKAKIVEKFFELTGAKLTWKPEMKNRLDYMRLLWQCNRELCKRTGIAVNSITGKIDMLEVWWQERVQEFGKNGKYVRVLQSKPLPCKEILDQIYSQHDVEQDERYSPHTLRAHLEQNLNEGPTGDDVDIEVNEASDDNGSQFPLELTSDEDLPQADPSPLPTTNEQARSSPSRTNRSNLGVRKSTSRRGYLAPYRKQSNVGTRYHLQEFFYGEPPRNSKEMFNRWHASLRSVVERTFGVWKKKWRVLNEFPKYNIAVQRRVIFATMGLHNFIRKNNIEDDDFEEADKDSDVSYGQQNVSDDVNDDQGIGVKEETHDGNYMKIVRDQIAEQIFITDL